MIAGLDRPVDDGPTGSQRLNLSLALAQRLLDTPSRQAAPAASQVMGDLLAGDGPLLVDHIELLFDPLLQISPLRALKLASRRRRLLVIWPGRLDQPMFDDQRWPWPAMARPARRRSSGSALRSSWPAG